MRAGRLDQTITVERRVETLDDAGTPVEAWHPVATARADLIQNTTEAFLREPGQTAEARVVFRVRFLPDLELTDRIVLDGVPHRLVEVKEVVRRRVLDLRCSTVL
ncbi:head-tail adaptor protein [Methylobacterium isbiliense]|jgi:head-tail adaptor|uniref:Head-tail adaptor protein n=1 Tax=Methylobacterium isbiliense TaxID=315478 RepID=A0ABQ4SGV5_9HYPH|nr:head-tail adaptor protein [Methylobacterium isbiliense]MDN3621457.1 head-tail adaptor protein [Methylobacterium isbiliense]GJE00906.1 hypothetical protein GMJLKIPL_2833 [Methylobacterium isbiliense]